MQRLILVETNSHHTTVPTPRAVEERIAIEQLHVYFQQLQAISIAPALGGIFTAWVLWDAVDRRYLIIGLIAVLLVSIARLIIYWRYCAQRLAVNQSAFWNMLLTAIALFSGITWGSAAIFIYPPQQLEYEIYLLVLMALVPVAPIAALATHLPSFFAYYLPCILPFIATLALHDQRADQLTALLLLMMMGATITFAVRYNRALTDSMRLRLQLSDQKDSLVEASKLKTRLMAAASHDLRQPLHAMGLFLETLRTRITDPSIIATIDRIDESTRSLRRMLNSMLDISRLDAGVVEVERHDFFLHDMLRRLHQEFAPLARRKGLDLRYVPTRLIGNSDPVLLEMIFRNILSNAVKYTHRGRVLTGCRRNGNWVSVMICDTGIGIPAAQTQAIFREFTQLERGGFNPDQGLGLGLAIVERLAGLLDHPLHVRSNVNRGTVFTIDLPRIRDGAQAQRRSADTVLNADPVLVGLHVALMDDDPDALAGMQKLLLHWGARVTLYPSSAAIFDHDTATVAPPDLLILDYHLAQGVTAPQVIQHWNRHYGHAPNVLIVTGDTSAERIQEAYAAGHLLLHKPVELAKLKSCIKLLTQALNSPSEPVKIPPP